MSVSTIGRIINYFNNRPKQEEIQTQVGRDLYKKLAKCAKILETPFADCSPIGSALQSKRIVTYQKRNFIVKMISEWPQIWSNHAREMTRKADCGSTRIGAFTNCVCNAILGLPPFGILGTATSLALGFTVRAVTLVAFAAIAAVCAAVEAALRIGAVTFVAASTGILRLAAAAVVITGIVAAGAGALATSPFWIAAFVVYKKGQKQAEELKEEIEELKEEVEALKSKVSKLFQNQPDEITVASNRLGGQQQQEIVA